ncbi:Uncharacterised protein [Vibrio cholerae]|nr:Uncharacterised protein [Vibrio cholerae]
MLRPCKSPTKICTGIANAATLTATFKPILAA